LNCKEVMEKQALLSSDSNDEITERQWDEDFALESSSNQKGVKRGGGKGVETAQQQGEGDVESMPPSPFGAIGTSSSSFIVKPLSLLVKLSYGSGAIAGSILAETTGFFLNAFLLSVARVDATSVGTLLLISKIFDAITDPFVGQFSDRTRTRWGRRRPWILFSSPFCAIVYYFMWQTYDSFPAPAKFAYYLFMYCLVSLSITMIAVPYSTLNMELTTDEYQRVQLNKYRTGFGFIGILLGVGIVSALLEVYGIDDPGTEFAYSLGGGVLALLLVLTCIICFFGVQEVDYENVRLEKSQLTMIQGIPFLVKNKPYLIVCILGVMVWVGASMTQNNLVLYFTYCLDMEDYFTYGLIVVLVSTILTVPLWGFVIDRMGKKVSFYLGMAVMLVIYIFVSVAPSGVAIMFAISAVAGLGLSVVNLLPWVLVVDVIDLDEIATGERREGLFCAFLIFFNKLAAGIGLAVSGYILGAGGYDENSNDQPDGVIMALKITTGIIPAGMTLVGVLLLYFYPITEEMIRKNHTILIELRQERVKEKLQLSKQE